MLSTALEEARSLDAADPLRQWRDRFHIPRNPDGTDVIYLCGNSLGLQPKSVRSLIEQELDDWRDLAVKGHLDAARPWFSYHEQFREPGARLVGARPGEVVMMNSLTVNLHLMMTSFYRPTARRYRVLMESPAFPSDLYAVQSHLRARGVTQNDAILELPPRDEPHTIAEEEIEAVLAREGDSIALVLIAGVNYFTGQLFDMRRIAAAAHQAGAICGFDLAHAAGNAEMQLHDWNVDFACWCSYKYLNAGPGAVAGCFVHERHGRDLELPRLAGWWGNEPETRFQMHTQREFIPRPGADGWQISNPQILSLAPLKASLDIFDAIGMAGLREKSVRMTGWLREQLESGAREFFEIITPRDEDRRGCQLSILVHDRPRQRHAALQEAGVVCDFREPNVIRIAPTPLYNSFEDCARFAAAFTGLD